MKYLILALAITVLSGCASATNPAEQLDAEGQIDPVEETLVIPPGQPSELPDLGVAPELNNEVWLNTDEPLRLVNLQGQVVLLDMWTFG